MNRLVRTELLKQRTTRTFVFGIALAPVVGALVTFANYSASPGSRATSRSASTASSRPSARRRA